MEKDRGKGREGGSKEAVIMRILKYPERPLFCVCVLQPENNHEAREGNKEQTLISSIPGN